MVYSAVMIPSVSRRDIVFAIRSLRLSGLDKRRASTKFCLVYGGHHFPPKLSVSLAVENARGRPLAFDEFSGGAETNALLASMGFNVARCNCGGLGTAHTGDVPNRRDRDGERGYGENQNYAIGRVVVQGRPVDGPRVPRAMLLHVLQQRWPTNVRVKFLITPGGFVRATYAGPWPQHTAWDSRPVDAKNLIRVAELVLDRVVTEEVFAAAAGKVEVLTIGIDLVSESDAAIELVAVFDVKSRKLVRWTGKSYPTSGQERSLVQVTDLDTHLRIRPVPGIVPSA